jgi:hypothetical protein
MTTTETIQDIDWIQDLITTEREAKLFIARLMREGLLWHFDDDPHDLSPGFDIETADTLEDRQNECWELLEDPHAHFPVTPDVGVIHERIGDSTLWIVTFADGCDYVLLSRLHAHPGITINITNDTLRSEFVIA